MRHDLEELAERLAHKLIHLVDLIIARLEASETSATILHLTIKGTQMTNYPLNAGDSVVVTITDTDAVTGVAVTPDAGSVTAVLSSPTDSIAANADGTFTITASTTPATGRTVTVDATVGGVASKTAVGTYDVVPAVFVPDATTLAVTFATETAPAAAAAPANVGLAAGQISPTTGLVNP